MFGRSFALGLVLWMLGAAVQSFAAAAPSDQIKVNTPFRLGAFDVRIIKIEWMRANGYLVPLGQPDPDGKGALVLTMTLRNASKSIEHLPTPDVQVIFRDATQTSMETRFPFDVTGKRLSLDTYDPGDGPTVRYIIASVPQPTAANPVASIIFSPRYTGDAGPGVLHLLAPPVTIAQ
jgi:hypothetical protein